MNTITFSYFIKSYQSLFKKKKNQQVILDDLFDEILLYDDNNANTEPYCISKQRASGIFRGLEPIPKEIVRLSYNKNYIENIDEYFYNLIQNEIDVDKLNAFISELLKDMKSDSLPDDIRQRITDNYNKNNSSGVVAEVFLYTLRFDADNKATKLVNSKSSQSLKKQTFVANSDITIGNDEELPYIRALYEVYGEKEKKTVTSVDENSKYYNHLFRQRKAYYDAECVRLQSRDTYKNDDPFDELESEMYDGIVESYENDYDSGYSRLQTVLSHASEVKFDSTVLCRETEWIKQSVKKGLCHQIVNDGLIKSWVNIDE